MMNLFYLVEALVQGNMNFGSMSVTTRMQITRSVLMIALPPNTPIAALNAGGLFWPEVVGEHYNNANFVRLVTGAIYENTPDYESLFPRDAAFGGMNTPARRTGTCLMLYENGVFVYSAAARTFITSTDNNETVKLLITAQEEAAAVAAARRPAANRAAGLDPPADPAPPQEVEAPHTGEGDFIPFLAFIPREQPPLPRR